jgi:hypothetical protein
VAFGRTYSRVESGAAADNEAAFRNELTSGSRPLRSAHKFGFSRLLAKDVALMRENGYLILAKCMVL